MATVAGASLDSVTALPGNDRFSTDDWVTDDCQFNATEVDEPMTGIGTWYEYDVEVTRACI